MASTFEVIGNFQTSRKLTICRGTTAYIPTKLHQFLNNVPVLRGQKDTRTDAAKTIKLIYNNTT